MADSERLATMLIEFSHTLTGTFPIQAILDRLVEHLLRVVPVDGAGVLLMGADLELHFVAASDEVLGHVEAMQIEFGEGPCIEAYRSGRHVLLPDLGSDRRFPNFSPAVREVGLGAVFAFPMAVRGQRYGAIDVYRHDPGALATEDVAALQVIADVAASYVFNHRSREQSVQLTALLRKQALHDALTGLPNRALLHDRLELAIAKARRSHRNVAVLFVDLDRFKVINDSHGHQIGDQTLIAVADRLRQALRPGDTLARLGGDEFVVLCEELEDAAAAEAVAKRVAGVLSQPLEVPSLGCIDLTASVGIAFAGEGVRIPETLLDDADAAMYEAKRRGGARYVVSRESVELQQV